jgi:hypothetical protein
MGRQVNELELMLLKLQTTFGTAETTLDGADIIEPELGAKLTLDVPSSEIELVSGGFPQYPSVIGAYEAGVQLSLPVRSGGAENNAGQLAKLLKMCGFGETTSDTDADSTNDRFIYAPSNSRADWKDGTVWGYSGSKASSDSYLRKAYNVLGTGKFALDFEKCTAKFEFNGKGVYTGAAAAATQPSANRTSSVITPALRSATLNLFGDTDYDPLSLEFDFGQEVVVTIKGSAAQGRGVSVITKRRISWRAKVYKDVSVDPETAFLSGTQGTISCAWGTAPNKITLSTTKAQMTSPPNDSDHSGVTCYDLAGICVDNDFAVQIDTAAA